MKILSFQLRGVLQSWGESSRWDNRDTSAIPTKSAVIGLLGACLGYPRGDERLSSLSSVLRLAVRVDASGTVMTDYQTVQAPNGFIMNAQGNKRPGDTIVTPRQYLQDAAFTVFLQGDEAVLHQCEAALLQPVWVPYLGRKCCVPSVPILPEMLDVQSLEDGVREHRTSRMKQPETVAQIEGMDGLLTDEFVLTRKDELVPFGLRTFTERKVRVMRVTREEMPCT